MVRQPLEWEEWPQARALLEQSIARSDDTTIEEVETALGNGGSQLWVALDGGVKLAGVTALVPTKQGKQCFVWQLGGEWARFAQPLLNEVEKWARAEGCVSIEGNMRPGFERRLQGWRKASVVMTKALQEG